VRCERREAATELDRPMRGELLPTKQQDLMPKPCLANLRYLSLSRRFDKSRPCTSAPSAEARRVIFMRTLWFRGKGADSGSMPLERDGRRRSSESGSVRLDSELAPE
jgi:hypothetical protein